MPDDFAVPQCPRDMIAGRDDLADLVERLAAIPARQETSCRAPTRDDVIVATEIMRGRGFPQADLVGLASESDAIADRLTEQQGLLLDVSS